MRVLDPTKEDWQTMVILDGCRYDCFNEVNFIEGELECVSSESLDTTDWYKRYWGGSKHDDIVLFHGIDFIEKFGGNFHNVYRMWDYDNMLKIDEQIEFVEDKIKDIDDKRVMIHFLQPHLPFTNYFGRKLLKEIGTSDKGMPSDYDKVTAYGKNHGWERIRKAYIEEIRYILYKLIDSDIEFDTITSDHGIRIGEHGNIYRHGVHCDVVHYVPWFKVKR